MVDIILTLALIALTVVSLLYIAGCDRLQTEDTSNSTGSGPQRVRQGG